MRETAGCWLRIASSAFVPQRLVVDIQSRWVNVIVIRLSSTKLLLDVDRNESTAGLSIVAEFA